MRKRSLSVLIFAFACLLLFGASCGESKFRTAADYIVDNGQKSADGSYTALTGKGNGAYFSAIYYADDAELAIGLRMNTEEGADALILIIKEDDDFCDLLFTRQKTGDKEPFYAGRTKLLPADPVCRRLSDPDGSFGGGSSEDAALLALVNGYLKDLFAGADACLFCGSGLSMADLGFKY